MALQPEIDVTFNCGAHKLRLVLLLFLVWATASSVAQENVVIQWNKAALQTTRYLRLGPPVAARAMAITHSCIFDAWSAFDDRAVATILGDRLRRPPAERTERNKQTAVSFAAYRCLSNLFPSEAPRYRALMGGLGFDPDDTNLDPTTPNGIGNIAALLMLASRQHDGSNQLGDLNPGAYSDYTEYQPRNSPDSVDDPDRWQPLRAPIADGGLYGRFIVQTYMTPHWGLVTPFALTSGSQFRPNQGPASLLRDKDRYISQAGEMLRLSADLTDEQKMIAEYWADEPGTETPPGHWCLFAQFVSARDHHSLDDDVKMFFVLTNGLLDAGIAAWDAKRAFDSVRPVTAVHFLFSGHPVRGWGGRFKGAQAMDGGDWQPYQPAIMAATPPFPEFISGHSTFSAAAAEILKRFTGSDSFGNSAGFTRGSSKVEPGLTPRADVTLFWPTFTAAANQAGMSREFCGIHFPEGDLAGRITGRKVGEQVWFKALTFINGEGKPHAVAKGKE
jgi:hypothetical protein